MRRITCFFVFSLLVAFATSASAYTLKDGNGNCPDGYAWDSDQSIVMSMDLMPDLGTFFGTASVLQDVLKRVGYVGGQWFDILFPLSTSMDPVTSGNRINEIGFADGLPASVLQRTSTTFTTNTCVILESDIRINVNRNWAFGLPGDHGEDFFDAGYPGPDGYYMRLTLLHELGHFVGLAHSDHSYSFMNYGGRPYANRDDARMVDFLPDDREALRVLYGNGGSETDVSVLNTWYDPTNLPNGAAQQESLCRPSTGTGWSSSQFDATCGVTSSGADGSMRVCPGDWLYTRYAMANHGTDGVETTQNLWFSKNKILGSEATGDIPSTSSHSRSLGAESSYREGRRYRVPSLAYGETYYPIIKINTDVYDSEESRKNNWIPLRGPIEVKSMAECLTIGVITVPSTGDFWKD
jgi:hypothetical protein